MLKHNRIKKNLSQQALADLSGINIRQIQKYESGVYDTGNMTLKTAIALADALEMDVRDLITVIDKPKLEPIMSEKMFTDEGKKKTVKKPSSVSPIFGYDMVDDGKGGVVYIPNDDAAKVKKAFEDILKK